jgi:predicted RNA-binding Zn-ribbon protein involved in translation (DUF1610 family)
MTLIQKLVTSLAPKRIAEEMEAESRDWKMICPQCGHVRSVWDAGGIRWKARSVGKRMLQRCPGCGKNVWAKVERRPTEPSKP